jgi:hypothetical protein
MFKFLRHADQVSVSRKTRERSRSSERRRSRPQIEALEALQLLSLGFHPGSPTISPVLIAYNAIESKAAALGSGFMGAAVSDLQSAVNGGYRIQFANCDIYDSPATGAHEIHGAIRDEYNATASETDLNGNVVQNILGLPTSDEMDVPGLTGARMNTFQGSNIYWSQSSNGAHTVIGAISDVYNGMGGPTSYLGLPTSDELGIPTGRVSYFQGGKILWTPLNGAYTVPAVSQMSFDTNVIQISGGGQDGDAWGSLTVYADGSFHFTGHVHDARFWDIDYSLTIGLVSPSGVLYPFVHQGSVGGTSDDDWDLWGYSSTLAAGWQDLEGATAYSQLTVSTDWNSLASGIENDIEQIVQYAEEAYQAAQTAYQVYEVVSVILV